MLSWLHEIMRELKIVVLSLIDADHVQEYRGSVPSALVPRPSAATIFEPELPHPSPFSPILLRASLR